MAFRASARFRGTFRGETRYLEISARRKTLVVNATHEKKALPYPDDEALKAAFAKACDNAEDGGWQEYGAKTTWRQRLAGVRLPRVTMKASEVRFETMSRELAEALVAAKGNFFEEQRAIYLAVKAYADVKKHFSEDRFAGVIDFFASDGIGLQKRRKPALLRATSHQGTLVRWVALLEKAVEVMSRP